MQTTNFERITVNPNQMGGVPCIRGLRIPVATVLRMLAGGMSEQEILADYRQPVNVRIGAHHSKHTRLPPFHRWIQSERVHTYKIGTAKADSFTLAEVDEVPLVFSNQKVLEVRQTAIQKNLAYSKFRIQGGTLTNVPEREFVTIRYLKRHDRPKAIDSLLICVLSDPSCFLR